MTTATPTHFDLEVSIVDLPENRIRLDIEVPYSEIAKDWERIKKETAGQIDFKGFRKNKTPFELAAPFISKKAMAERFYTEVVPSIVQQALAKTEIEPFVFPKCKIEAIEEEKPLSLQLIVPLKPKVVLGDYKKIKIWQPKLAVTDQDVDERLDELRTAYSKFVTKNGSVADGDTIQYDRVLVVDGNEIARTAENNQWLEIARNGPLGDFADNFIGIAAGESCTIETLQETGSKATHRYTIKAVMERILPSSDKEILKASRDAYPDSKTIADLKDSIRKELEKEKKDIAESYSQDEIRRKLVSMCKVEMPPELLETVIEGRVDDITQDLKEKGLTLKEHLAKNNLDEKSFREQLIQQTKFEMTANLITDEIAENEGLYPDQVMGFLANLAKTINVKTNKALSAKERRAKKKQASKKKPASK